MIASIEEFFGALDGWADRTPGQLALASRAGHMNYSDLVGNIASASVYAMKAGIRPGQLVVVGVSNPDMALILALALMRIGCRVGYVRDLDLYDESGVAVDAVLADPQAAPSSHRTISVTPQWFAGAQARSASLPPPAPSFSLIVSSSGSTGRPKLIEKPRTAVYRGTGIRKQMFPLIAHVRVLSVFGSRNSATLYDELAALMVGGTILRPANRSAAAIVDTIQLFRPDSLTMSPAVLSEVIQQVKEKPALVCKAQSVRVGGAYCAPELQGAALDLITREIVLAYGSNETGLLAWGRSQDLRKLDRSVGRLFDDVQLVAVDANGNALPAGIEGELWAKTPDEGAGSYIGNAARSPDGFRNGWFRTGDIGFVDENRNLIIRGRATNVINTGGGKVSPELLEDHIRTMPGVVDVGVAGVAVPEGYEKVCAALVSDARPPVDMVSAHLIQRREFSRVHMVKYVAAIPRTQTGKIDRVALKRLCADQGSG